jgi:hypothetical protein
MEQDAVVRIYMMARQCQSRGLPSSGQRPYRYGNHHDNLCAFGGLHRQPSACSRPDAEAPVWNHVTRIGDGCVREGLADNGDRDG